MNPSTAILLLLLIPLLAIVLTLLFDKRPNVRELFTLLAGISLVCVAGSLASQVFAGERPAWSFPFEMVSGLPIAFRVEPLGMLFALV
ncbi:MAG: monovalent cation/H+ antiporter subunit D family protein, partial [Planctomycetaceae bacterium]|nr:monovalent cation/H+ antiporter subunit D family protein [Planctomycetaceae bacterium]